MNYSNYTATERRLRIAANGFQRAVQPGYGHIRQALRMKDIANNAGRENDTAENVLAFAVFVRAAEMAGLKPRHILGWISRQWGNDPIRQFASAELGMVHRARKVV